MEEFGKQAIQLIMFWAFIHSVVEVLKYVSAKGVLGIVKELWFSLYKNAYMSSDTLRTLVFALALLYCWAFDYGVMSDMLGIQIEETNNFAWWLDYIGTASVVFEGVAVFYARIKKMKESLNGTVLPQLPPNPPPKEG